MGLHRRQSVRLTDTEGRAWVGHVHRVTEIGDGTNSQVVATVQLVQPIKTEKHCTCSHSK